MNSKKFIAMPAATSASTTDAATTAKEMLAALSEKAKAYENSSLMAKISELQGLHAAYELTSSPAIMDAIVVKLGCIIGNLLDFVVFPGLDAETIRRADASGFVEQFKEHLNVCNGIVLIKDWIDAYVCHLESQGKKPQTMKIYKGKVTAVLPNREEPISIEDLKSILNRLLEKHSSAETKDHNLISAIKNFLVFIQNLLDDCKNI